MWLVSQSGQLVNTGHIQCICVKGTPKTMWYILASTAVDKNIIMGEYESEEEACMIMHALHDRLGVVFAFERIEE